MDELVGALRRQRAVTALVPLFFLSGATGLVYQTIWARQLHLVVGTTTFAIATVLAAFMAGLALGGAVMARRADTTTAPLTLYGVLEIGIGAFALVFPGVLGAVETVYLELARDLEIGPVAFGVLQGLLVGGVLVVPTAAMGATLPLLARFATDRLGAAGDRVGLLYAVNTGGAVFGTWLAGFVLLPGVGLAATTWLAAGANVLLGAAALALASGTAGIPLATSGDAFERCEATPAPAAVRAAVACAVLAGFSSLVYEVAWFRVLGLMLGGSAYAFSTMLLAFLVGIALGGRVGGALADHWFEAGGRGAVLRALALVQLGVGAASLLMMHLYQELPFWYVWLFDALGGERSARAVWAVSLLLAGLVMTPPALLMGVAFPLTVRAALGRADDVGGAVGRIYAANTAGGVVGAALAGFVLLPGLAVRGTVGLAASVNALAAGVAWLGQDRSEAAGALRGRASVTGAGLLAVLVVAGLVRPPGWDPLLMTAGMYKYVSSFEDHTREGIRNYAVDQYELVYYREGLSSVVTVARNLDSGNLWLANNGKVDASTTIDMPTQVMVSLLPLQHVEQAGDVLVIGLASGITAGAAALADDVSRLDVVELEPAILEAARWFDPWSHGVLDDPRTRVIVADGRNHLLRARPQTYDVIVSEPSNPWLTGVSNLFTAELFALGRSRLKPGGVWAQWVQLYGMREEDLRSLLGTFSDAFPYVQLYAAAEDADLVLLGAERPLPPTLDAANRLLARSAVAEELAAVQLGTPADVLATWLTDRAGLLALAEGVTRNSDDNMRIEYGAPLALHRDTQAINVALLERASELPVAWMPEDPDAWADLGRAYHRREDVRAIDAMLRAGLLASAEDPRRAVFVEEAFGWYVDERTHEPPGARMRAALEAEFLQRRVQPLLDEAAR